MMMNIANTIPKDTSDLPEYRSRAALRVARRVVIKAGTAVIANEDGKRKCSQSRLWVGFFLFILVLIE